MGPRPAQLDPGRLHGGEVGRTPGPCAGRHTGVVGLLRIGMRSAGSRGVSLGAAASSKQFSMALSDSSRCRACVTLCWPRCGEEVAPSSRGEDSTSSSPPAQPMPFT